MTAVIKNLITSILFITIALHSFSVFASLPPQTLMRGKSKTLTLEYKAGDVAVADPSVCDYIVSQDRRSLYINARNGGETIITLWDESGVKRDEFSVKVVANGLKEVVDRAEGEFGDLEGVKVKVRSGHVELEGEVVEPEDFKRIENLSRQDPRVRSRVRLSTDVIDKIAEAIRKAIHVPGVTVRSVRDRVVLEGVAYSTADAKRAVEIAKLYSPDVMDLIDVRETKRNVSKGRMIELSFHMMEIKRGVLKYLGINWAPGALLNGSKANAGNGSGAGLLSSVGELGSQLVGFVMQFVPKLSIMRERGDGRVLENPTIIVKSGEEAKVFSGSEVPYYKDNDVQFKKVGIEIDAVPIEVENGVDLKLNATLSAPASDLRGAIDTHTISTTVMCPIGQSLVFGNIVRNGDMKMKNRVPGNIDTSSALFTLFLSKDFQSNRSEFVIFVTPKFVDEPSPAEAELQNFLITQELMNKDRSKNGQIENVAHKNRRRKWL